MEEVCPHWGDRMKPLGPYARPRYCSKCLEWLSRSGKSESVNRFHDEVQTSVAFWHTQAVAELLG